MKKIYCIFICIVLMISLTGCNEDLKSALQDVIDIQIQSEDTYTPLSYSEYLTALAEAKLAKESGFISSNKINTVKVNLENAITNLCVKPDKTPLQQKLEQAQQIDPTLYIPESIAVLNDAIEHARNVYENENTTDYDLETAIDKLETEINSLLLKADKSALEKLLDDANKIDENKYTTVSANKLSTAIFDATDIMYDENVVQGVVDATYNDLKSALNNLVRATSAVYKIDCSLKCLSSNHVGSDWRSGISYNGETIRTGDTITVPINSAITIKGTAVENDSVPDYGSGTVTLPTSGEEKSTRFYVRENRGRYAGYLATWNLTGSATLIERK